MTTQEIKNNLIESIKAIESYDFLGASGVRYSLYLDPENYTVDIHHFVGNSGWPMRAHNSIDKHIIDINVGAVAESVVEAVLGVVDTLVDMCESFLGIEWDGSNHKGLWEAPTEGGDYHEWEHPDTFAEVVGEIKYYWAAEEWFVQDHGWVALCKAAELPVTATVKAVTKALDEFVEMEHPSEHVRSALDLVRESFDTWSDEQLERVG